MRIEMPEKRKKYDREFREGAVRIVEDLGPPVLRPLDLAPLSVQSSDGSIWAQRRSSRTALAGIA